MSGKTLSKEDLKAAVEAYAAANGKQVSEGDTGKFTIFEGTPHPNDPMIWLDAGKPSSNQSMDFLLNFIEAFIKPVESPRINDLPKKDPIIPPPQEKPKSEPLAKPQSNSGGFRKAQRRKAKLRLGITGPAGSGKTMSALLIAGGLVNGQWGKVGLVDTENGSGDLYVFSNASGSEIGEYNVLTMEPPFDASKYIRAIKAAEEAGLEVVILDSISHAWAGEGGFLEKQGKIADKSGNSWSAWRTVTPEHNRFIDAMLQSKIHVIATMRSKTEHVYEGGKVKKVGMAPVAREGMEYEFSVVFDMDQGHNATPTKDRTSLFDGQIFKPSPETGKMLLTWLEAGA